MKPNIAIIDYGMGNLRSVAKAFERVEANPRIIDTPDRADECGALILPGVGAFGQAMERLRETRFDALVRDWVRDDRPFLGICLGLQLLSTESEEFGPVQGIDIVPGRVVRFTGTQYERSGDRAGLKVPHMGWNTLKLVKDHPVTEGMPTDAMAYFVHSYYCVANDPNWTAITTDHGVEFTCAVARGNMFASQFHPEKSGDVGLQMLANFVGLVESAA